MRASLERHVADLKFSHNRILRGLVDDRIVRKGEGFSALYANAAQQSDRPAAPTTITLMEAAAKINKLDEPLLRSVLASAKRLGVDLPLEKPISMFELDLQLRGKDISARMALKGNLHRLGVLAA